VFINAFTAKLTSHNWRSDPAVMLSRLHGIVILLYKSCNLNSLFVIYQRFMPAYSKSVLFGSIENGNNALRVLSLFCVYTLLDPVQTTRMLLQGLNRNQIPV
jgi:hypothetical protein